MLDGQAPDVGNKEIRRVLIFHISLKGLSGTLFGYGRRAIKISRIRNIFTKYVTIDVQKMSKTRKKIEKFVFRQSAPMAEDAS